MEHIKSNLQVDLIDDVEAPPPGILVSKFDYSVENHFKAMDNIAKLSGESAWECDQTEIQRLSSSITFLKEWRDFCYQPRFIRFACQSGTPLREDVIGGINLPQFSSAAITKEDIPVGNKVSSHLGKDFVMYVGGLVWALDWCPRVQQNSDSDINVEFIAVAVHPPESSYHKIGAPFTGRGVIQIWCVLNAGAKDQDVIPGVKETTRKYTRNGETTKVKASEPKRPGGRPRGRPRKNPIIESVDNLDDNDMQPLSFQLPEEPIKLLHADGISQDTLEQVARGETDGNIKSSTARKPRGGPKRKPVKESVVDLDGSNKHVLSHAKYHDYSPKTDKNSLATPELFSKKDSCRDQHAPGEVRAEQQQNFRGAESINPSSNRPYKTKRNLRKKRKIDSVEFPEHSSKLLVVEASESRLTKCQTWINSRLNGTDPPLLSPNSKTSLLNTETSFSCGQDRKRSRENIANPVIFGNDTNTCSISVDVALPKLVMCLAHNGKVAWDVKWRPSDSHANLKHRMGYLGVLLGNGALEVWEVPLPRVTKAIFSRSRNEGIDPRFIKLEPVFRCSMLKCGDRQSIPLTLEWSASSPHDLILAGCHDGVVALWKFSASGPSKDTRPLLCFSADDVPIRALAWEPVASDSESANVIVTAGHKGVKFWDLRDPFRPLWEIKSSQKIIYSLDWLPDPRCVLLSFDDGEIRIISLLKAACDVPVTGVPFAGTSQQGLHSYHCSSSSIWSIQVSRLTGTAAYCCSDGTVLRFQLTRKAVEKNPHRNRAPHYLCSCLTEDESTLTVLSPQSDVPFPIKKSSNEWGDTPRSRRGFVTLSNQDKRAKEHNAKSQTPPDESTPMPTPTPPLALCYGNDPGIDSVSDDMLVARKSKPTTKTKNSSKEAPKPTNEVLENMKAKGSQKQVFPPKMVAMHRVRWNTNKGSERWLCCGGAAGILRCQEINLSTT